MNTHWMALPTAGMIKGGKNVDIGVIIIVIAGLIFAMSLAFVN